MVEIPKFSIGRLWSLIRNNPDYFGAVATAYMVVGMQVLVQLALIPLYLSSLGKYQFGILMLFMSATNVAYIGISWAYGGILRILGEAAAKSDNATFADGYLTVKFIFAGYALVVGALALAVMAIVPGLVLKQPLDGGVLKAAFAAVAYFILLCEFTVDQMALNARKLQSIANLLLVVSLAIFAVLVVPWLHSGGGVAGVFVCFASAYLVVRTVVWLIWRRRGMRVRWRAPVARLTAMLGRLADTVRQGYLLYGLIFMALQSDVLLVGWLGGAEAVAEFALVRKPAEILIIALWRLSESLMPELVHTEAAGDQTRLHRIYGRGVSLVRLAALAFGVAYGLLGHWLVTLWVGVERTPDTVWGYPLAGAVVVFLGSARFPAVFVYALARLRPLIVVTGVELTLKFILFLVLFRFVGYLSPLLAVSIVHIGGIAFAYARLPRSVFSS